MHSGHCHSQKVVIGRKWYSLIQLYTYKRLKGILNRKTLKLSFFKGNKNETQEKCGRPRIPALIKEERNVIQYKNIRPIDLKRFFSLF